ncbi:MAG: acetylxylan esterase [Microbacteriaceae bacterium]|nr:acetylxylan esterase [Microbacteriaceae bacterium]
MPLTDLPLEQLREYRADLREPADFDAFWRDSIAESRALGDEARLVPVDSPISELVVEDLTFPGYLGEPIRAWVTRPVRAEGPLPAVIEYLGYNGGRGLPGERLQWASAGYVHVLMDTRGQGSGWGSGGDTPDPHGSGPAVAGFMTRGILDPHDYFYRRLFVDAVRLVDAVGDLPFVEASRIAVTGVSQGGGITLAVGGLVSGLRAVMPDVPFLCDFRHSVEVAMGDPFTEVSRYLAVHRDRVDRVFATLAYFDGASFARRIDAPTLMSTALMDEVVPPSGMFAAFNEITVADKSLEIYAFNGHEGGGQSQWLRQTGWLAER